jgi:3-hydroxyisobutyrate dehydrogenase-like beta-hydroxyacid dehydrogenase
LLKSAGASASAQAEQGFMNPVVAVIAPGNMGAPVGGRLVENGLKVLTSLTGRSAESRARAAQAGLIDAADKEIAAADFILSIVPPADALPLAQRFAPALSASNGKPVYVECNAVSPATVERIAAVIAATGCPFVDAGIIGSPPRPGERGPRFYASGPHAKRFAGLAQFGLDVRVLDGPVSAASALKMSYGGITKGVTALGAAMFLAATRGGSAEALYRELKASQPQLLPWLDRQVTGMYSKAYRWVAEMEEVSSFAGEDADVKQLYAAIAQFYDRIARDFESEQKDVGALKTFLGAREK